MYNYFVSKAQQWRLSTLTTDMNQNNGGKCMKKIFITLMICLVVTVGGLIFFIQVNSSNTDLAIKETAVNSGVYGLREFDLTYENLINKVSTNVLIGVVTGKEVLNNDKEAFKVSVQEQILGETNSKEILIYASNDNFLELEQKYFFILSENSKTVYDKDFYVQDLDFVLKVLNDGSLLRLIDVYQKKYEAPFINNKYNKVDELVSYTKDNFSNKSNSRSKAIKKIDSHQILADKSDHIVEIKIQKVIDVDNGLVIVDFEISKKYKNGKLNNGAIKHSMLLPQRVIGSDKEYLVFLTERNDTSVTLTTRENSIIAKSDSLYKTVIEEIKD